MTAGSPIPEEPLMPDLVSFSWPPTMALRGKPREPFYMVGRMEGQSVVLRAEKGKLRLMVDDEEGGKVQEMVYEVNPQKERKGGERWKK